MEEEVEEALEAMQDMQISDWGARTGSILYDRADYFCKQGRILVAEVKRLRQLVKDMDTVMKDMDYHHE